ncbi:hypothetical protein niasHS_003307 [Heterodera schachtii]|uniref:Lysosome-associated membrane glycoprotein 2-like transmembrane domain-containing protein n=1 Tax=Heterodera schachtii TaxID=97005 RepID=A0ABD2KG47_HETSC
MNRSVFSPPNCSLFRLAFFLVLCSLCANAMKFAVKGDDNKYCILLDSPQITGAIRYEEKNGSFNTTTFSLSNSSASVDKNASSCDASIQRISLEFAPLIEGIATEMSKKWNITLEFTKKDGKNYALSDYSLGVVFFPAQKASQKSHVYEKNGTAEWGAQLESEQSKHPNGFTCSENKLALSDASTINFEFLKLVAFDDNEKDEFRDGQIFENCPLDARTSDLVPIVVGALLAGLVVIVLIAYLIGRARAKRQGYTSV